MLLVVPGSVIAGVCGLGLQRPNIWWSGEVVGDRKRWVVGRQGGAAGWVLLTPGAPLLGGAVWCQVTRFLADVAFGVLADG